MINFHNKGFTLAEALIVMSILGVVAALTVPQVGYNMQKSKNAAILGKTVQLVEGGCRNVVSHYNSLLEDGSVYDGYSSILIPGTTNYMVGTALLSNGNNAQLFELSTPSSTRLTGYTPYVYSKSAAMTNANGKYNTNGLFVNSKIGSFTGIATPSTLTADTNSDPITDIIYIDVNAENKPNELGKDIFIFGLTDRCNMVPAGSNRMKTLGYPSTDSNDICPPDANSTGLACADLVVKDGFKINY